MTKYPLTWPQGWKRTPSSQRKRARFSKHTTKYRESWQEPGKQVAYAQRGEVTIAEGTSRVLNALRAMGVPDVHTIISSNLTTRNDGLPRSGQAAPDDPGVAVYWTRKDRKQVMAIDQYDRVADNLAAIAATLEAMRAIERHGGAQILERAFTGFDALPAPKGHEGHRPWRRVLGLVDGVPVSMETVKILYRKLAVTRQPDNGGSHEAMTELNGAYAQAERELA